ncbi:MAG: universal stress protein [Chloroflexota bacterium]
MNRRILFATDLSTYAGAVLDCLAGLRRAGVRHVLLLHVVDQAMAYIPGTEGFDIVGQLKADARKSLEQERRRLEGQGLDVAARLEVGVPAKEIVRVAEEEDVWLIVVGAYGRTLLQDVLLGSVAERVLHLAKRPVLVERARVIANLNQVQCYRRGEHTFERVLFATDFSPSASAAQQFVVGLHSAQPEEVIVLHVLDERLVRGRPPEALQRLTDEARRQLDSVVAELARLGLNVRGRLERGEPVASIVEITENEDAGSVVMGSRGRGVAVELLLGSTAEGVARRSHRPVVIVPARKATVKTVRRHSS